VDYTQNRIGADGLSRGGRTRRLKRMQDCRKLVADAVRRFEQEGDARGAERLRAISYAAKALGDLIKDTDYEERLMAVERALGVKPIGRRAAPAPPASQTQ